MENKHKILYLLLGIGVGIIIANILHSAYPKIQYVELNESQIVERAKELGMVSLKESIKTEKETVEDTKDIEEDIGKIEELEEVEETIEVEEMELVVQSGSSLTRVARQLYDLGLIESQEEFIIFVKDRKQDKKIITGKYKIRSDASYEDIIETIVERPK